LTSIHGSCAKWPDTTKGGVALKLNLRIGHQLGITAGLGVLLVGGIERAA
jgi:hypothetical protein